MKSHTAGTQRWYDVSHHVLKGSRVLMSTSVPLSGTELSTAELAVIRRLRTTASAACARTRMQPHRRELLRDALVTEAENPNDVLVENVGYGTQSVQPRPLSVATRYKSTSRIVELNGNIARAGNLHTLNNPSPIGGQGGACSGDSGGPVLVNNTNEVLAVVSFGYSGTCHGADYSWRVDTRDSYGFILPFLS